MQRAYTEFNAIGIAIRRPIPFGSSDGAYLATALSNTARCSSGKGAPELAPGARPFFPIDRRAPIGDFEAIVKQYPMFRVETGSAEWG